jgi:hypothetical protein
MRLTRLIFFLLDIGSIAVSPLLEADQRTLCPRPCWRQKPANAEGVPILPAPTPGVWTPVKPTGVAAK